VGNKFNPYPVFRLVTDKNGNLPSWYTTHSPKTLTPDEIGAACKNESSSEPACYEIADIAENYIDTTDDNNDNPTLVEWDFSWGLEIELDLNGSNDLFFGSLANIDLSAFGYKTGDAVIRLDALHASDPKTVAEGHHDQNHCGDGGAAPNHEPCAANVVNVVNNPTTDIPEPSTLAIFSLGLLGLISRRFKK
jgi:hypothetical protein